MGEPEIPTVTFCDLARNQAAYFDKTIRLNAVLELQVEGQYLTDEHCPLNHDDRIGFGYAEKDARKESIRRTLDQIGAPEYRHRAEVRMVGVLRNVQMRGFAWYGSLFEVAYFERARPAVALYDGDLEEGRTYRAKATRDAKGEVVIEPPLRVPFHHAGRIEWTAGDRLAFPKERVGDVVFRVVDKTVVPAGPGSWRTTFHCELIRIE